MMSAIDTVRTFVTAMQSADMGLLAGITAEDFILRGFMPREMDKGEFLAVQSELVRGFPDLSYDLADLRMQGHAVHATTRLHGTHSNDLTLPLIGIQTIPATGLAISLPVTPVEFWVADERITGMHIQPLAGGGLNGLLQQIGGELPVEPREREIADPAYEQKYRRAPEVGGYDDVQ